MRRERAAIGTKGWYFGPWNSDLSISVGYANEGVNEPHLHTTTAEIYVVGRGRATVRVGHETVELHPGDALVVEPGEPHTFLSSSSEYFHVVLHVPGDGDDEKRSVPRADLD